MPALKFDEIKLTVDLDNFSWGDLEDVESQSQQKILDVCARLCVIEIDGKPVPKADTRATLRRIHYKDVQRVIETVTAVIQEAANPVDETGKN